MNLPNIAKHLLRRVKEAKTPKGTRNLIADIENFLSNIKC